MKPCATPTETLDAARSEKLRLEMNLNFLNHELLQATIAAVEVDRDKTDLVTRIGHNLRAPMTAIVGFSEMLLHSSDHIHALNIAHSSRQMLSMINGLMESFRSAQVEKNPTTKINIEIKKNSPPLASNHFLQHTQQEVFRLEKLIRVRTTALQDVVLLGDESKKISSELLGCVKPHLLLPVEDIIREAEMMVRAGMEDTAPAKIILRNANQLKQKVESLIRDAQLHELLHPIRAHPVVMQQLLKEVATEAKGLAKINGNRFEFRPAGELTLRSNVDSQRLRRVLLELLGHAAERTRHGEIVLHAEARRRPSGSLDYLFQICDTGPRLGATDLQTIFEPFGSSKEDKSHQKLRLAMAKQWITLMKGELLIANLPDRGMTRTVMIPVQDVPEDGPSDDSSPQSQPIPIETNGAKFLEVTVSPGPETLSEVSNFISMGAISDLIDWANSTDSQSASWSRFASQVNDLAGQGDLQGLAALRDAYSTKL